MKSQPIRTNACELVNAGNVAVLIVPIACAIPELFYEDPPLSVRNDYSIGVWLSLLVHSILMWWLKLGWSPVLAVTGIIIGWVTVPLADSSVWDEVNHLCYGFGFGMSAGLLSELILVTHRSNLENIADQAADVGT